MMKIDKDTPILSVLEKYPATYEVFERFGMSCINCMGAETGTIGKGAKVHRVNVEELLDALRECIEGEGETGEP